MRASRLFFSFLLKIGILFLDVLDMKVERDFINQNKS